MPSSSLRRRRPDRRRVATVVVVALLHIAAIFALLRAFDIDVVPDTLRSVASFAVPLDTPEPAPEPEPEPTMAAPEPDGAAAPEAAEATPREDAAPKPRVERPAPPAPPAAAKGNENRSGAGETGTGSGGGGDGIGTGSGGSGTGPGGGGAAIRGAEKIAGEITARDFPRNSAPDRNGAFVIVYFTVGTDGRARDCSVRSSSGNAEVDRITCRLVVERFRYRPAIGANGDPVAERTGWKQWWWQ
ncbi:energy transducer TonB [uncultured Croceicoccus sp.]|uniref:energy transducer TonB n=1 Tax=uncultured Croceicoccus sp. TaxID=1295329 RepID=UPI00260D5C88|nr:energy transducer TonB [uncultured Croceicoccus sp.]